MIDARAALIHGRWRAPKLFRVIGTAPKGSRGIGNGYGNAASTPFVRIANRYMWGSRAQGVACGADSL
ncbi:hypothetical protein RBY4I_2813 [Rhodobacterales bacterium Y4I]|nr:hypothetical protein RBY4I_2813 [Rhodobacterales bacterium Y4I]